VRECVLIFFFLLADKVCSGNGTLALTPQCLQVLHESFERILSRLDNHAINGSLPVSLNEFAGYRELSFMYDIVQLASSLKVGTSAVLIAPCSILARGNPSTHVIPSFPHLLLYLLVSFTFFVIFSFLLALSIFLFSPPFPYYQNSPTLLPVRMS